YAVQAGYAVATPDLELGDAFDIPHEFFLVELPSHGKSGKVLEFMSGRKDGQTISADTGVQQVLARIIIGNAPDIGHDQVLVQLLVRTDIHGAVEGLDRIRILVAAGRFITHVLSLLFV